ncbi:hypothetical protein NC00_06565 [Xanthomonas cannabis pv. phaseoli]|uniref:Uncharacterized protein n=1 Tax=Xanthomonas cannabis pv. phaseoli TaxID=1885902 RepID=A0AB34PAZ8_9XANT|nr:hypothetical protein NC00_06565 [Xanthomonas cannabis pv. phaseoli]
MADLSDQGEPRWLSPTMRVGGGRTEVTKGMAPLICLLSSNCDVLRPAQTKTGWHMAIPFR